MGFRSFARLTPRRSIGKRRVRMCDRRVLLWLSVLVAAQGVLCLLLPLRRMCSRSSRLLLGAFALAGHTSVGAMCFLGVAS